MEYVQATDDVLTVLERETMFEEYLETAVDDDVRFDVDTTAQTVGTSCDDSYVEKRVADTLRAINHGFDKHTALRLVEDDLLMFATINVKARTANDSEYRRQMGRIIGEDGRTRELFEELTGAAIQITDGVVAAIGRSTAIEHIRRGVDMLLNGAPHSAVYGMLEDYSAWRTHPMRAFTPPGE